MVCEAVEGVRALRVLVWGEEARKYVLCGVEGTDCAGDSPVLLWARAVRKEVSDQAGQCALL